MKLYEDGVPSPNYNFQHAKHCIEHGKSIPLSVILTVPIITHRNAVRQSVLCYGKRRIVAYMMTCDAYKAF